MTEKQACSHLDTFLSGKRRACGGKRGCIARRGTVERHDQGTKVREGCVGASVGLLWVSSVNGLWFALLVCVSARGVKKGRER